MVLGYERLSRSPKAFHHFSGVSLTEFAELYRKLEPLHQARERQRLSQHPRLRAIGGGRKYELSLEDRLLMTLMWLRLYLETEALAFLFGVHKSTVSRNTRDILACLRELGEATLGWPEPPPKGRPLEEALAEYPELLALVDATEQRVQRPKDCTTQKAHYSGKKKSHTRKTQVIVNEHGVIREVSPSVPGAMQDLELFRQSGAKGRIPKAVTVGGDKGYQGLHKELPEHSVVTPHKATRGHPLDEEHKRMNGEYARIRIVVEHTLGALKQFHALADVFRHSVSLYDTVFRGVVAIVNPRIVQQVAAALTACQEAQVMHHELAA